MTYKVIFASCLQMGSSCGVMVNVLDCDIVVKKLGLQSRDYIYFQTHTLGFVFFGLVLLHAYQPL